MAISLPSPLASGASASAPATAAYETVVVEAKYGAEENGPIPSQIASVAGVTTCRWWDLAPDSNGPLVDDVTHLRVPSARVQAVSRAVAADSKYVVQVTTLADRAFNSPPGPSGTPIYYSGSC